VTTTVHLRPNMKLSPLVAKDGGSAHRPPSIPAEQECFLDRELLRPVIAETSLMLCQGKLI